MNHDEYLKNLDIKVGDLTNKGIIVTVQKGFLSEPDEYYTEGKKYPDFYTRGELKKLSQGILQN